MFKKVLSLGLVAATVWTSATLAQETSEDSTTPQTQVGSDLDLGEEGPRVGEQYAKETVADWTLICLKTETENDPCLLRQILTGDEGQPVAEISVNKLPEGSAAVAAASVTVPLEVLLQAQIALSIDGAPGKRYDYHHCNPIGCVARMGLTQGDLDALKSGSIATLSLVSVLAPTQLLQFEVSLAGFTAGYDKLVVNQN